MGSKYLQLGLVSRNATIGARAAKVLTRGRHILLLAQVEVRDGFSEEVQGTLLQREYVLEKVVGRRPWVRLEGINLVKSK